MFSIHAQVLNCFSVPASEKYPEPSYKVQLLGDQITKDGQVRKEMLTMGIPFDLFKVLESKLGKSVRLPVGLFATDGRVQPFFPKGHSLSSLSDENAS